MEPLAPSHDPPTRTGPKLTLLSRFHPQPDDWKRTSRAVEASVAVHVIVVGILLTFRIPPPPEFPPDQVFVKHATPLYIPPELTQKAPNKTPPKKDLVLEAIQARPVLKAPSPAPPAKQAAQAKEAPKQMPLPPVQPTPQPAPPKPVIAEAPKLEVAPPNPQPVQIANALPPAPTGGSPKLTLEDVPTKPAGARPTGGIALPNTSVESALRAVTRGGAAGASTLGETVSDEGSGPGMNLPASAGQAHSSLQLKSDPMGVDFRPYMIQVLAAVRRNWFAVYPEAAKTGMRGQVILQFRIDKKGAVVKVGFNGESPSRPLNEAAVAAISASNPMPPLPSAFKGDSVVLQMTFLYNMPK